MIRQRLFYEIKDEVAAEIAAASHNVVSYQEMFEETQALLDEHFINLVKEIECYCSQEVEAQ